MKRLKIMFSDLRFRCKLFITYLSVTFVAVTIVGAYSYFQSMKLLEEKTKQTMDYVLQIVISDMENSISVYNDAIMNFITNKSIYQVIEKGYNPERDGNIWHEMDDIFLPTINTIKNIYPAITRFTLYTDKHLPEIGKELKQAKSVENEKWYIEAMQGFRLKWEFYDNKLIASYLMQNIWGTKISDTIGVLYIEFDAQKLFANIEETRDEEYILLVTDEEDNCIYSTENNMQITENADNKKRISIDGKEYIYRSVPIDNMGWNVRLYMSASDLGMRGIQVVGIIILTCFLSMIVLGFFSVLMSGAMTKRIYELHANMKKVQNGEFDIEIYSDSKDEIGYITNCFGDMVKELKKTVEKLYETKIAEQKQEMKALQAQINPHFLYNVLSTMKWKAIKSDDDEITYMVEQLSNFYRTSLNGGKISIDLGKEIENVKAYVSMQLIMHDSSFDVYYDIDEALYNYRCINFIIQPIAENAIAHGIDKIVDGRGVLKIKTEAIGEGRVCITVSDNGPGMESDIMKAVLNKKTKGYGVWNVQERLRLAYGEECGILYERINGETIVKMILPKEYDI